MRRRDFVTSLAVAAMWLRAPLAQQTERVYRIGVLEMLPTAENVGNFGAFQQALRDLGYVEGKNLVIEYRSPGSHDELFPALAAELSGLNLDLLVTRGTPAVLAAKSVTKTTPVVMAAIADPLVAVASIKHPGENVTGFSALLNELNPKRVEMLKDAVPQIKRIAFLDDMGVPTAELAWAEFEAAARSLGLGPQKMDARRVEDLDRLFDEAVRQHVDALVVTNVSVLQENRRLIAELALRHRLPAIYGSRDFVDAGGLMTYGPSYPDLYRRAASYVDKIFKGANPGDLPIEQPTKFELIINLKTAKALGLELPTLLLARADELIE